MLAWTIYISFLGATTLMLVPRSNPALARTVAMLTAVAGFCFALCGAFGIHGSEIKTIARYSWIPSLGINYYLAADGISIILVLLTGLAAIAGILFSWNIDHRTNEFFAL